MPGSQQEPLEETLSAPQTIRRVPPLVWARWRDAESYTY